MEKGPVEDGMTKAKRVNCEVMVEDEMKEEEEMMVEDKMKLENGMRAGLQCRVGVKLQLVHDWNIRGLCLWLPLLIPTFLTSVI